MYRIVFLIIKEFHFNMRAVLQSNEFLLRELRTPCGAFAL